MGAGPEDSEAIAPAVFDAELAAQVNAALIGELDQDLAIDPGTPFGEERRLFAALYVRHRFGIAQRAGRYLRDPRDVEEVVQETFLRLFLALPELDNEAVAVAWCRRTATNLCIDRYRAAARRPSLIDLELVIDDIADEGSIEDPMLQAEDAAIVRQALSLLSPQHREALIKREIEEKTFPQIAAEMDIPEETVKHLLYRARRALRRLLVGTAVAPGADLEGQSTAALLRERARGTGKGAALLLILALVIALPRLLTPSADDVGVQTSIDAARPLVQPSLVQPSVVPPTADSSSVAPRSDPAPADAPASTSTGRGSSGRSDASSGSTVAAVAPPVAEVGPPSTVRPEPPAPPVVALPAPKQQPAAPAGTVADAPSPDLSATTTAASASPEGASLAPEATSNAPDLADSLDATSELLTPRYYLTGAPVLSNEGFLYDSTVDIDPTGRTTSYSRFVAPTTDIDLSLNQTLIRYADGTTEFRLDPVFGLAGGPVASTVVSQESFVLTHSDGSVSVVVTIAMAHPGPDLLPSRITATLRYSSDLVRIVSEDVELG